MLTLAVVRTPERVFEHFAPAHRYGGAARRAATRFGKGATLRGLCNPVELACLLPLLLEGQLDEKALLGRTRAVKEALSPVVSPATRSIRAAGC